MSNLLHIQKDVWTICKRLHPRKARQLIIHQGGHMKLQCFGVLIKNWNRSSIELIVMEPVIDLDDVSQFVSEIILGR